MPQSWNTQQTEEIIADDIKGLRTESGQTDSGFLSGANIGIHVVDPAEYKTDSDTKPRWENVEENFTGKNTDEQMRVDSGIVEGGLCETLLSHLTLKPVTINCLNETVQSEPTLELSPINEPRLKSPPQIHQRDPQGALRSKDAEKIWRLYFSQDEDGDTQLHIAIVQGFHEVALSLIRMAPHPSVFDCLNQKRQSALHLAVLTHQPSITRHLILAGADPSLRDSNGNTALHLASASGDLACAKALTNPLLIVERKCLVPGRQAPGIPQDLEQPNYEGETCLHSAVVAGNTEIIKLLIGVGADLEARERLGGRTALHLAIECRRSGVASLLLKEYHPHLDALTYGGLTAYEIASCWNSELAKELVRLGATPGNDYIENNDDISKIPQLWSVGLRA